jgi:hypothetical protein
MCYYSKRSFEYTTTYLLSVGCSYDLVSAKLCFAYFILTQNGVLSTPRRRLSLRRTVLTHDVSMDTQQKVVRM